MIGAAERMESYDRVRTDVAAVKIAPAGSSDSKQQAVAPKAQEQQDDIARISMGAAGASHTRTGADCRSRISPVQSNPDHEEMAIGVEDTSATSRQAIDVDTDAAVIHSGPGLTSVPVSRLHAIFHHTPKARSTVQGFTSPKEPATAPNPVPLPRSSSTGAKGFMTFLASSTRTLKWAEPVCSSVPAQQDFQRTDAISNQQQDSRLNNELQKSPTLPGQAGSEQILEQLLQQVTDLKEQLKAADKKLDKCLIEMERSGAAARDAEDLSRKALKELGDLRCQFKVEIDPLLQQADGNSSQTMVFEGFDNSGSHVGEEIQAQQLPRNAEPSMLQTWLDQEQQQQQQPESHPESFIGQMLLPGGLSINFGIPKAECLQPHMENLSQCLQSIAQRPFWNKDAIQSWLVFSLDNNGKILTEADCSWWRSMVIHALLTLLRDGVFDTWHLWAGALLGSDLLPQLHSVTDIAASPDSQLGAASACVYQSACLVHVGDMCRLACSRVRNPIQTTLAYSELVLDMSKDLCNRLVEVGFLKTPNADMCNILKTLVHLAVQLWMRMRAAHPLLTPIVSPIGRPCEAGKATITKFMKGRLTKSARSSSSEALPESGCFVLASLCPGAAFVKPSLAPASVAATGREEEILMPEIVLGLQVVP